MSGGAGGGEHGAFPNAAWAQAAVQQFLQGKEKDRKGRGKRKGKQRGKQEAPAKVELSNEAIVRLYEARKDLLAQDWVPLLQGVAQQAPDGEPKQQTVFNAVKRLYDNRHSRAGKRKIKDLWKWPNSSSGKGESVHMEGGMDDTADDVDLPTPRVTSNALLASCASSHSMLACEWFRRRNCRTS
jgi:hypothetical protein